ncbi:glycosyltransferase [Mycobacterium sp. WMMD1722]|uniref:glycosyltransferase n=1 Tax=Mycobacterium sp. WMMD1722 TaxID=3404117 RepID=UPI003BF5B8AD
MRVVLASWGSRGEVEPLAALARELLRRGHDVELAVAPDMVPFGESAGLPTIAYGPDWHTFTYAYRDYWTYFFRHPWRIMTLGRMWRAVSDPLLHSRPQVSATLMGLTERADVLVTGMNFEETAANVAEAQGIPLATLHWFPLRANSRLLPFLPKPLGRRVMTVIEWLAWGGVKRIEDVQRRELGLSRALRPWQSRIAGRGSLEIQAYDAECFPGLASEWASWNAGRPPRRPFVGALTLEMATAADEDVLSWIAAGTPPIFFGFGSMPVASPADTIATIASTCARLGERALIAAALSDFSDVPEFPHVKVVGVVNFASIFPVCRAVVHHGGAGTTAASLRAGVPTLILSMDFNQTLWGAQIKRLKVGTARHFSRTTGETLFEDLRTVLAPQCGHAAREVATRLTKPDESVVAAADLVEEFAGAERPGRRGGDRL